MSSTFVVKSHIGGDDSLILKLYTGTTIRSKLNALEVDLRWQRGLVHPHLLGITSAGICGRRSFYTTRPFSNSRLDLLKANSTHITQFLDAVRFLHKHGRPHGCIKPSNVFADDGNVRLADLRLADCEESSSLDSIRFTAPEVLLGEVPTIESDYYSVGAILYRIYARRDPFDDSISENLKTKYLQVKIPTIREVAGLREPVAGAIDGLLHRNPRRRNAAFRELIRAMPFARGSVSRTPMVGRHETFERIYLQVSSTAARTLTVDLVEGDAGTGKSRLVEELQFRSNFRNSDLYTSVCLERAEPSLAPIIRLVRTILLQHCTTRRIDVRTLLGSFEGNLAPLLGDFREEHRVEGIDHPNERVVQDLIGLISLMSRKEHLRLCIEDIDKAEAATRSFIKQICCRASELNVRLILTCRNSEVAIVPGEIEALLGNAFTRVSLGPLTRNESLDLINYLESDTGKQKEVLDRAGGNPLWLLEHARNENSQWLATSIHAIIQDEADVNLRKLLHTLAVSRGPSSVELLARVVSLDIESVAEKLSRLRQIGAVQGSNHVFEMRLDSLRSLFQSEISARSKRTIHEAIYKALQREEGVVAERLAEHAFHGGLLEEAASHFVALAKLTLNRGDYVSALCHFGRLTMCLKRLNQKLSFEEEIAVATCLARTGKSRLAERIYVRLLAESDIHEDLRTRLSLMYRGGDIDSTHLDERLTFLRQALESSRYGDLHASSLLSRLCNASVRAGDLVGAADALNRARGLTEAIPDKIGAHSVKSAEGFLMLNKGEFRIASEIYRTLPCGSWDETAAALTNQSVCLEHLGNLRAAVGIQKRAHRLASKSGHLVGQFLCLGNLAVFTTKLGNFKEAGEYFGKMKELLIKCAPSTGISFKGGEAEKALLDFNTGKYNLALQNLSPALNSTTLLKNTRLQLLLLKYELLSCIAIDELKSSDLDQIASEGSWSDSPLYAVQLALLRSRTKRTLSEALSVLDDALETARNASLLYEICRLELEIADRLHELDPASAKPHAEEALRISKKNGYRPLQCRALMLRAVCSRHDKEKEHYLSLCFKLATIVEIPEIVSESSYHLGVLYESMNRHSASRECFANSTRVTSEIADEVPARFRSSYLARSWRKDARRRYEELLLDQPIKLHAAYTDPAFGDHLYFRALYRISIAAASSRTVDDFLRELMPAMGLSRDSIVAMLTREGHTFWYSHGIVLTDALRLRVLSVAAKARDQARFNSNDRWIPFRSLHYSGGICVLSRKRNQLGEQEMEFFTILGIFVSNALDQIHNRLVATPVTVTSGEFHGIVGSSRPIRDLCAHIARISNNGATVLIQGETGTGKELVARAIHRLSARSKGPFIAIDCGAIAEGLLESELFGSKRGSFTGAIADRPGVFEAAHTGTLFLDEISNMNLAMQAKLLRVLQEREIRRVGDTRNRSVDVRLVAASNTNLKQLVAAGAFRQDLLFRLNVIAVSIPPLRARREDIPFLASYFLKRLNSAQKTRKVFGSEALELLPSHDFPGNVRELQNAVERGFFTAPGQTILSIPIETSSGDESINEVRKWLADLAEGRRDFWTEIRDRYKRRDISREKVVALIDLGLRTTRGSYKNLASLLHIDEGEYRRLMDFLRRNNCLLDFRPYRKVASLS